MLGFAPHCGWAAVVVLGGTPGEPLVLARERLELTEARLEGAKQPYHAIEGLPIGDARARLTGFEASAARLAASGLRALAHTARAAGVEALAAGILDSTGRSGATLEAILASHALIHSADGQHFRAALEAGCAAQGLPATRIRQRDLGALAAAELRRSPAELRTQVARLGREIGAPWGADQKGAALIAWLLLVRSRGAAAR
ncbi:MAG TPA: hypothetical protein VNX02_10200 [Steroidobacteraceae bacterium]|nr:hypothetical protein [Steroidobacteraceae bacterium]